MRFDEHFIRHVIPDVSINGILPHHPSFAVDSRNVQKDDIFVALPGMFCDGHSFIGDALQRGAAGVLYATEKRDICMQQINQLKVKNKLLIEVADPLQALIAMAIAWRKQFNYPVIGVTGSFGKTSAKETIAAVLKAANKTYIASQGNQNTHIGIAMNIFRMRSEHEVAVFEMGITRPGEMAHLARIVRPTIGVITGIGHCHMEGLGSLQDIAAEKRDIFKYFTEENIGIVHGDQPILSNISFIHPVIKFGAKTTNQIQVRKIRLIKDETHCILKIYKDKYSLVLPKSHVSVITSTLVAAAVGHILSIDHAIIVTAVQKPVVIAGRFEKRVLKQGKGIVINDCYNANPESMKAAFLAFEHFETKMPKMAVIGDMLELGINSPFWHRQIGRFLRKVPSLQKLLLVGTMVEWIEKSLPLHIQAVRVTNWQEARNMWTEFVGSQEVCVLMKASRGIGLLNLVDHVTK
jgi:UDP-N-acetylmuramoyl-tripeptide--D-alanyl-D-alanine ligase